MNNKSNLFHTQKNGINWKGNDLYVCFRKYSIRQAMRQKESQHHVINQTNTFHPFYYTVR